LHTERGKVANAEETRPLTMKEEPKLGKRSKPEKGKSDMFEPKLDFFFPPSSSEASE